MRHAVILAAMLAAAPALAQTPPRVNQFPQSAGCADFRHNPDGSWSVLHPANINGVLVAPGAVYRAGQFHQGIDIALRLASRCP